MSDSEMVGGYPHDHLVSVVVSTKNEQANIANCLRSLRLQSYSNIEIIVVDNFSADDTVPLARKFADHVLQGGPERSAQRNLGLLEYGSGSIFAYIDADMILGPEVVEAAVRKLNEAGVVGVYVRERILGTSLFAKVRAFERSFYDGTVVDAVRFVDASAFRACGGFDESLFRTGSGEDWDLDLSLQALGRLEMVVDTPVRDWKSDDWPMAPLILSLGVHHSSGSVIFHNESSDTVIPYLRKKLYYTRGFDGYITKWGRGNPRIRKQFSPKYRLFSVFTEHGKWKSLLSRPHLAGLMLSLRFGVGLTFALRKTRIL